MENQETKDKYASALLALLAHPNGSLLALKKDIDILLGGLA
jgi:hypothetical protein